MKKYIVFVLVVLTLSCKKSEEYAVAENANMDSSAVPDKGKHSISEGGGLLGSIASQSQAGLDKQFAKSADIKFKVADVAQSTYRIEDVIWQEGGFVSFTKMQSNVEYTDEYQITEDSTMRKTHFTIVNDMVFRVPQQNLSKVLNGISKEVKYLDYRNIESEDVTIGLQAKKWEQQSVSTNIDRVEEAIDKRGKKLEDIVASEQILDQKRQELNRSLEQRAQLDDKVKYSTIHLYLYQDEGVLVERLFKPNKEPHFKPSLGHQLFEALQDGCGICVEILVFLVKIWWVIVILGLAYYFYCVKYKKKVQNESI